VSGATPIRKVSDHYFFKLSDPRCESFLREWTQVKTPLQTEAKNKMKEWVGIEGDSKLGDWDISRDAPYFGFEIPDAPSKYFYVWLDAPIGYYASFLNYCKAKGLRFNDWVKPDSKTEQYHFIGKDILYFHTLFWPATLHFSGYRTPTNIFAHGFLTVDGEKMSKSRGTLISANSVIEAGLNPEWFRYYFATKLNASMEDLDLNLQDFVARVNSDLLGKYINIASRSAGFLVKRFEGRVLDSAMAHPLLTTIANASNGIAELYESREYAKAIRQIMELADLVNGFVDENKPWDLAKDLTRSAQLHEVCSVILESFRCLSLYLKPVLPKLVTNVETFLGVPAMQWKDIKTSLKSSSPIQPYKHLMTRVEQTQLDELLKLNL
jgi:methionyl-tRNA synthetase